MRRVLATIVLLDYAKGARLLRSDPCLLRPGLSLRSSKEVANEVNNRSRRNRAGCAVFGRTADRFPALESCFPPGPGWTD